MSKSGDSSPESNDSFKSAQENFELNPALDINSQESENTQNNVSDANLWQTLDLDTEELNRIFSEPFEEITVSSKTNEKLEKLAAEKNKELLPGDTRKLCKGSHFKAVSLNEIEAVKMATIAEKMMNQTQWGVITFKGQSIVHVNCPTFW